MCTGKTEGKAEKRNIQYSIGKKGWYFGSHAFGGQGKYRDGKQISVSTYGLFPYSGSIGCLFSVLGISNRRKNGLKWAFVSIEFRKNTYFNCAFTPCFAPESDLQN